MKTLIGTNIYLSEGNTYIYMSHKNEQYVKYLKFYVFLYKCVLESQQNILFTQKTYYKEHFASILLSGCFSSVTCSKILFSVIQVILPKSKHDL